MWGAPSEIESEFIFTILRKQATLISQLVELQSQMDKFKVKYKTHIAKDFVPLEKRVGDLEQSVNQDSEVSNQENLSLKVKGEEQQKALMLTKNELHDMYRALENEVHDMYRPFQTMREKLDSTSNGFTLFFSPLCSYLNECSFDK